MYEFSKWMSKRVFNSSLSSMFWVHAGSYDLPIGAHSFSLTCNATDSCNSVVTVADLEPLSVSTCAMLLAFPRFSNVFFQLPTDRGCFTQWQGHNGTIMKVAG